MSIMYVYTYKNSGKHYFPFQRKDSTHRYDIFTVSITVNATNYSLKLIKSTPVSLIVI